MPDLLEEDSGDMDKLVTLEIGDDTCVYNSVNDLLSNIQVTWDTDAVCLQFHGTARWIFKEFV